MPCSDRVCGTLILVAYNADFVHGIGDEYMRLHQPVLWKEAVELLHCQSGGFNVDCTLGMGGHAEKILQASSPDGVLLAIDRDPEAIAFAKERLTAFGQRLRVVYGDYRMLKTILATEGMHSPSGILADLGPSMLQFSTAGRGFSFQLEGPLDMRMDPSSAETAAHIINTYQLQALADLLRKFGEEKAAYRIAKRIVEERRKAPIETTTQLRTLIEAVKPRRHEEKIHPATQTFQALRIAVNQELENLDDFVFDAFDALNPGGRLVLIAFHSLEDRIIKQSFAFLAANCRCPKQFQTCQCGGEPFAKLLTKKPVTASAEELKENPASRSAKLRALEKLKGTAPRNFWESWLRER
jgi:16S rRNA (cytosine1402-N4)-methyltransferase